MRTQQNMHADQGAGPGRHTQLRGQSAIHQSVASRGLTKVDIPILLDATMSMGPYIEGARQALTAFLDTLRQGQLDVAAGLVVFRDELIGELTYTYPIGTPCEQLKSILASTQPKDGGDFPESSLPAVVHALDLPGYRPGAQKMILMVTDAPPHDPERGVTSGGVLARLKHEKVSFFACTSGDEPWPTFARETGGQHFVLRPGIGADEFAGILVKDVAATTIKTALRGADSGVSDIVADAYRTRSRRTGA